MLPDKIVMASGNAGKLRVDISGVKLLEALGLDATQDARNLTIEVPIEIHIAEAVSKSGYRAGAEPVRAILVDKDVAFKLRQKAQAKATGRH